MKTTPFTLETTAKILIRCFWMGAGLQLFWAFWFFAGGEWAYEFHSHFFDLSRHEYDLMMIFWLALWKICLLGVLLPYFAIRMVLRVTSE
jgi:uncharacterized membrane protein